ncbi:MAG: tetratricopeptide repeat protein [Silicimonas sp.]|nr:tetratricopeptide repeat protein [Silicimonas sp.]NND19287.1 tetratricopeptide repeat protein [Silicimonas sp.]NND42363.1 tetratricopeptide repeat protein [Silicimonas sp.]NNF91347.1 tetratricopeptide repeat protein [Boseongicola sp.]RZW07475.1 MAG: tetratricopeptide repeat protein [Paracoccaceae bacterium]
MRHVLIVLLLAANAAFAECPAPPDIDAEEAQILAQARAANSESAARPLSAALWELWATAPDQTAQELLDRGMGARASWNFLDAMDAFDRLVEYCPDYAEGYNQRAFVSFLREDFSAALVDLELALERRPTHVAALSGKALTLMGLGRHDEAQEVLREALALNPWIPERGLLQEANGEEL